MDVPYDPFIPDHWQDPYAVYRRLREEAPLHRAPESRVYCVSRYADVAHVLKRHDLFSSQSAFEVTLKQSLRRIRLRDLGEFARFLWRARLSPLRIGRMRDFIILTDPPRHDALRAIVDRGFTPRRIQAWEQRAREIVQSCTAPLERGQRFDVVRDLAVPLPVTVIAEMLGVDPHHQDDFSRWSEMIISGFSGTPQAGGLGTTLRAAGELHNYTRSVARQRRERPTGDLISVLVDPSQRDVLDDLAILQFILMLLVAGNETTTHLIANAVNALLDHPHELARIDADPRLLPLAVEEALRFEAPAQFVLRRATQDAEIAGGTIPAGSPVAALIGSANRDERQFPDPDRFDVARNPKDHLAFGAGLHFCLGAALARLEARLALGALVPHLLHTRRASDEVELVDSYMLRGPRRLELASQDQPSRVSTRKSRSYR